MTTTQQRTIHGYEVIRELGRGGMATVHLAYERALDRYVALKELSSFYSADSSVVERFLLESKLTARLNNPNIVTVHRSFEYDGVPYIAMEYLPRGSLRPYLHTLSFAQFVGAMETILAGLDYAASKGIVHRDMKPENLMVTDEGRVKIGDFGIAKATVTSGLDGFRTNDGMTVGTPSYMAPEQAVASKDIGPWTDLYSVGIIAYEYLTGRPPFCDCAAAVILFRQVNEAVPPVIDVNPRVDREISDWVGRLLTKDPLERIRSPMAAWEELEDIALRRADARWRREARLPTPTVVELESRPVTPAEFRGQTATADASSTKISVPRYVTFPPGRPGAEKSSSPSSKRRMLCADVLGLCDTLAAEVSAGTARDGLEAVRRELNAQRRLRVDSRLDAERAAAALRRLEELPWAQRDLQLVTNRIEELQEKGAGMQLVKLARWRRRCEDGEVQLPADRRDELERLLSAASAREQLALRATASEGDLRDAARERALAWRAFEGGAAASPMARRVAADVVRFYEEIATSTAEQKA